MTDTEFNTKVDARIDLKLGILLEHMDHKFKQLFEAMDAMIEHRVRPIIQEELVGIKEDLRITKLAVKHTNRDVHSLNQQVIRIKKMTE